MIVFFLTTSDYFSLNYFCILWPGWVYGWGISWEKGANVFSRKCCTYRSLPGRESKIFHVLAQQEKTWDISTNISFSWIFKHLKHLKGNSVPGTPGTAKNQQEPPKATKNRSFAVRSLTTGQSTYTKPSQAILSKKDPTIRCEIIFGDQIMSFQNNLPKSFPCK